MHLQKLLLVTACSALSLPGIAFADRNLNRPGWALIWHDEFDGPNVDGSKWNVDDQPAPANNELEWYSRDNVYIDNGNLVLKSEVREINGYQYASGKVTTAGKFDMTYGRVEIRADLPTGQGIWPAHWMLPYGKWPPEIDITEMIGSVPNRITMSVHWGPLPPGQSPWDIGQTRNADFWGPDFSQGYHDYALEWYSGWLSWQIDGVQRHSAWEGIPQEPMFLILNTAVGGDWPGPPDGSTPWPQFHQIDHVRVYGRIYGPYALLNSSFEDGVGDSFPNWNRWDSGNVIRDPIPANARSGDTALQMFGRFADYPNNSGIYQSIPAAAGERWRAGVWARNRPGDSLTGDTEGHLKLEFVDAGGAILGSTMQKVVDAGSPETYTYHEIEASAPPGTAWARPVLDLVQSSDAPGSANFDDVIVERVEAVPGTLANADFEQWDGGSFVGWTHYSDGNVVQDSATNNAQSGLGAVQAWGRFDSDDNRSGLFQDLEAEAGSWWEATVFARNRPLDAAAGDNLGKLKLEFVAPGGAVLATNTVAVVDSSSPEIYLPFVVRGQAPAGTAFARIVLEFHQFDFAGGAVNFDDASLRPISAYRAWIAGYVDPDSPAADPSFDIDRDGQDNGTESIARTSPVDPNSSLRVDSLARDPNTGEFVVSWRAMAGVRYRVVATSDLGEWDPADPAVQVIADGLSLASGEEGELFARFGLSGDSRFVRVEASPPGA